MLDDGTIRLRALDRSDLLTLHGWENLSSLWRSSSTLAPYSLRNVADYIDSYRADPFHTGELRLMVEQTGGQGDRPRPVGMVELYEVEVRHRRANVGLMVDPRHQRHHVGTRALALLEGYCRDHLGLNQLLAYIPEDNDPSRALFGSRGYAHVATLPGWLAKPGGFGDALIMQKVLAK